MAIVYRLSKGSDLTHSELDGNFADLQTQLNTSATDIAELQTTVLELPIATFTTYDLNGRYILNEVTLYQEYTGDQTITSIIAPNGMSIANTGPACIYALTSHFSAIVPGESQSFRINVHNFGEGAITFETQPGPPFGPPLIGDTVLGINGTATVEWVRKAGGTERIVVRNVRPESDDVVFVDASGSQSGIISKRKWKLTGDVIDVPVTNGFEALYVNTSGVDRSITPASPAVCIVAELGLPALSVILANNKAASVMGDGTNLLVFGDVQ